MTDTLISDYAVRTGISAVAVKHIADISIRQIRDDILRLLPSSKIVIAACLSYRDDRAGNIPSYTRANYYRVLSKMLHKLGKFIKHSAGDIRSDADVFRTSVNSVLNDKLIAYETGLGGFADNHLIAVSGVGSATVLGTLIIDAECDIAGESAHSHSDAQLCSHCGACFASCPTGALTAEGVDKCKCLQHNSSTADFNPELIPYWGDRFFGCSICTDCCPINADAQLCDPHQETLTGYIGCNFDMGQLWHFRKGDYKAYFRANQLAATWMEEVIHPRNILTALHNSGHDDDVMKYAADIDRYGWSDEEKKYLSEWCRVLTEKEHK